MARAKKPSKKKPAKTQAKASLPPANIGRVELEVHISADQQRVWNAIIHETPRWWRRDFNVGGESALMTIEPRVGGRMFEDWGNDRGALWGTVLLFDPPSRLELVAHLTPSFGGPATCIIQIALRADRDQTVLSLSDSFFGRADQGTVTSLSGGWKLLFAEALKQYVEGK